VYFAHLQLLMKNKKLVIKQYRTAGNFLMVQNFTFFADRDRSGAVKYEPRNC
jgi:hypothetical protein